MKDESVFAIDVNLGRGAVILLALALVLTSLMGYMAWGRQDVSASGGKAPLASSANLRKFYLTTSWNNGAEADTACATGYHMASLWEIEDPTNLKYNTTLGETNDDSGEGPPTGYQGWVRTGYDAGTASPAGQANCDNWDSNDSGYMGSAAALDTNWTTATDILVWGTGPTTCNSPTRVWCIED